MAAVCPLDTTNPGTFNGVTYQYDAAEDRWFVISTNKVDEVGENLETLSRDLDDTNVRLDEELRTETIC